MNKKIGDGCWSPKLGKRVVYIALATSPENLDKIY